MVMMRKHGSKLRMWGVDPEVDSREIKAVVR